MTEREAVEKLVLEGGFEREDAQAAVSWAEEHKSYTSRSAQILTQWGMGVTSYSIKFPLRS